jgi:dihydrodipicolinate synthase/N-acetylneuraminate lyase
MARPAIPIDGLCGVFAVPPLPRRRDPRRTIDFDAHLQCFGLSGMTTGSGCIAPRSCGALFAACQAHDWAHATALRATFMPLEDLRDAWGPARVLHHATELCGIASTGPIPPFVSPLNTAQVSQLTPVATALREADA